MLTYLFSSLSILDRSHIFCSHSSLMFPPSCFLPRFLLLSLSTLLLFASRPQLSFLFFPCSPPRLSPWRVRAHSSCLGVWFRALFLSAFVAYSFVIIVSLCLLCLLVCGDLDYTWCLAHSYHVLQPSRLFHSRLLY